MRASLEISVLGNAEEKTYWRKTNQLKVVVGRPSCLSSYLDIRISIVPRPWSYLKTWELVCRHPTMMGPRCLSNPPHEDHRDLTRLCIEHCTADELSSGKDSWYHMMHLTKFFRWLSGHPYIFETYSFNKNNCVGVEFFQRETERPPNPSGKPCTRRFPRQDSLQWFPNRPALASSYLPSRPCRCLPSVLQAPPRFSLHTPPRKPKVEKNWTSP